MNPNMPARDRVRKLYDAFSRLPWFWEIDAITCRATEDSPYRAKAIELLTLQPGQSVLDVACGTGLNFKCIQQHLKAQGHLTGIDLSTRTLHLAQKRVKQQHWQNIDLIATDSASFHSGRYFDAALCTFAIEIIPAYQQTIEMMIRQVKPGGRIAIIGFKPSSWDYFNWFNPAFAKVSVLFGAIDLDRSVRADFIRRHCREVYYQEVYGGFYYVLVVQKEA